jgi:hypothetical protein
MSLSLSETPQSFDAIGDLIKENVSKLPKPHGIAFIKEEKPFVVPVTKPPTRIITQKQSVPLTLGGPFVRGGGEMKAKPIQMITYPSSLPSQQDITYLRDDCSVTNFVGAKAKVEYVQPRVNLGILEVSRPPPSYEVMTISDGDKLLRQEKDQKRRGEDVTERKYEVEESKGTIPVTNIIHIDKDFQKFINEQKIEAQKRLQEKNKLKERKRN